MKKVLVLMLVLAMTSAASAVLVSGYTVIDAVTMGTGSSGNAGTASDPLVTGETINIKLVVNGGQTHSTYAPYNGFWLSMLDVDIDISNATAVSATVATDGKIKSGKVNAGLSPYANEAISSTGFYFSGSSSAGIQGDDDIVWDIVLTAGTLDMVVDLGIHGTTQAKQFKDDASWTTLVAGDLGDLTIVVPEPITIALLGLGGLFLRRRK